MRLAPAGLVARVPVAQVGRDRVVPVLAPVVLVARVRVASARVPVVPAVVLVAPAVVRVVAPVVVPVVRAPARVALAPAASAVPRARRAVPVAAETSRRWVRSSAAVTRPAWPRFPRARSSSNEASRHRSSLRS
jgi:hypothetical protein